MGMNIIETCCKKSFFEICFILKFHLNLSFSSIDFLKYKMQHRVEMKIYYLVHYPKLSPYNDIPNKWGQIACSLL